MSLTKAQLKTWYEGFSDALATDEEAERKLLITAVDVGTTESTPVWEVQGVGVEESAIEYNDDTETKTDILGIARTSVNKMEPAQEFDPNTVRGGAKLRAILDGIVARNAYSEFSGFTVLVVKMWLKDADGKFYAEKHKNCTIKPTSIGGSSKVDMPFSITYSNDKTYGTVTDVSNITFTEATVSA